MALQAAWTALTASPQQARSVTALAAAGAAMAAALVAPPLGLLALAGLACLVLITMDQPAAARLDGFAAAGLVALAAGAASAGLAGATGVLFIWFVTDCARAQIRRSRALGPPGQGGLAERAPLGLSAAFAILLVAASAPHVVMGLPLSLPQPPAVAIWAVGLLYALAAVDWLVRNLARWRLGEGQFAPCAADAAFHAVLLGGFALCPDVSAGLAGLVAYRLGLALRPASLTRREAQAGS